MWASDHNNCTECLFELHQGIGCVNEWDSLVVRELSQQEQTAKLQRARLYSRRRWIVNAVPKKYLKSFKNVKKIIYAQFRVNKPLKYYTYLLHFIWLCNCWEPLKNQMKTPMFHIVQSKPLKTMKKKTWHKQSTCFASIFKRWREKKS